MKKKQKLSRSEEGSPNWKCRRRFLNNGSDSSAIVVSKKKKIKEDVEEEEASHRMNKFLKTELQRRQSRAIFYKNTSIDVRRDCEQAEAKCAELALKLKEKEEEQQKIVSKIEELKALDEELNAKLASCKMENGF